MDKEFNISSMLLSKEYVSKIVDNNSYNRNLIFEYYLKLAGEVKSSKEAFRLQETAYRLKDCNTTWIFDKYELSRIKDFKKTYLCRDKFCANCKKVKQAQRMRKYIPLLEEWDSSLYFVTFTVPNCSASNLKDTIKKLYSSFSRLVEYFSLHKKIRGVDFSKFNYKGCIKSLEVSFREKGSRNRYHPHLHCAFIFNGYKPGKEYLETRFSVDHTGRRNVRLFNRETVMLQKVWYLLNNNITVKKDNFKFYKDKQGNIKENKGYSVVVDKFKPGQYQEMFKYMVKDKDMSGNFMDYEVFKTLYYSLHNVRQLQGYGIFYGVKDVKDKELMEEVNSIYKEFIEYLSNKETPVEVSETPQEVLNNKDYLYITKRKIYSYLSICVLDKKFEKIRDNYKDSRNYLSIDKYKLFKELEQEYFKEFSRKSKQRLSKMRGFEKTYYL